MTGTSTLLSVLGADGSGEANLTYTWTVAALPTGAAVPVLSVNGTNAAKNTLATFSQAGTYTFTATLTDPVRLAATSSVTVVVSQTLASIQVTPANVALSVGATQQFAALGFDQFGAALASPPNFTWAATGGGTIDATRGLFTAPLAPANSTVTATSGSLTGTARASVTLGLNDGALDSLTAARFLNDGTINRQEMIEILRSTGSDDNVVDAREFADLQTILNYAASLRIPSYVQVLASDVVTGNPANALYQGQALGNLAADSPADRLNKLVDKWFLGADHPATSYAYQSFAGSLFVNSSTYTDMRQGNLGDCYFIAALGAIAKSSQAAIQNMFIDNGDNTWTVRYYYQGTADYVTVDRSLPISGSLPVYQGVGGGGATNSNNELWLALAEKAYAQWNETGKTGRSSPVNSYGSIVGGWMGPVSDQVLGRASATYSGLPDSQKQLLIAAINGNKAVTYGTKTSVGNGLVGSHAYVFSGYDSATDTFRLHNPWGYNHPAPLPYARLQANGLVFVIADAASTSAAAGVRPSLAALTMPETQAPRSSLAAPSATAFPSVNHCSDSELATRESAIAVIESQDREDADRHGIAHHAWNDRNVREIAAVNELDLIDAEMNSVLDDLALDVGAAWQA